MQHLIRLGALALLVTLTASLARPTPARADDFAPGSLIIPMDTTYQDMGMLEAFGLLYQLLQAGVPVQWCIRPGKAHDEVDFTTSARDHGTGAAIASHGYRAGPFVIHAADAAAATPIVDAWQATHTTTVVHEATVTFTADVARRLVASPNIAIFADGNEDIARGYLQAAGIPDSTGSLAWAATSPDMLTVEEVSGPTLTNHADGALFDAEGNPAYCQIMSMHWAVRDAERNPEVVAEVRSYLNHPVHFFAECQAVNAFENEPTYGHFLTPHGFLIDNFAGPVDYLHQDEPFAQLDGPFELVGGSERAYSPCRDAAPAPCVRGGTYLASDIVMLTRAGTPEGIQDVWMTGYLDGACPPQDSTCGTRGKVSYLGGHEYSTRLPISRNPDTQGTRLFLQSLFEAPCTSVTGVANIYVRKSAVDATTAADVTYTLEYANIGMGVAYGATLTDTLPVGATFVSATGGGAEAGGVVTWSLGNVGRGESGTVTVTVRFAAYGTYENVASMQFRAGTATRTVESNRTSTLYAAVLPGDAGASASDAGASLDAGTAGIDAGSGAGDDAGGAMSLDDAGAMTGDDGGATIGVDAGEGTGADAALLAIDAAGRTDDAGRATFDAGTGAGADAGGSGGPDSGGTIGPTTAGCGCRAASARARAPWLLGLTALGWILRARQKRRVARP